MIWAVTGTRHGATPRQLVSVAWLFTRHGIEVLHDGDAVGVDEQVYHLACAFHLKIILHPPSSPKYRAFCSRFHYATEIRTLKPYHERDEDMVDESEALVSVQWKAAELSRGGTRYTTDYARSLNRPVALVWPNGHITYENWTLSHVD